MGFGGGGSFQQSGPSLADILAIQQFQRQGQPPPAVQISNDPAKQARNQRRRQSQSRSGLSGSRVTSGTGLINPAPTDRRTLLGQ